MKGWGPAMESLGTGARGEYEKPGEEISSCQAIDL